MTTHHANGVQIDFDEDTHTYRIGGVIVPGVTQIIDSLYDFSGVDCDVLERASEFGKAAHRACELYDTNNLDEESVDPALSPYLDAWIEFRRGCSFTPTLVERVVYSRAYKYCGKLDRVGYLGNQHAIIDIKTSTSLSAAVGVQLAGYALALREEIITNGQLLGRRGLARCAVKLNGDGNYKVVSYSDPSDESVFLSLLNVRNWRKNHGYQD